MSVWVSVSLGVCDCVCVTTCVIASEFVCQRLSVLVCVCRYGCVILNVCVYVIESLIEYVEFGIFCCL